VFNYGDFGNYGNAPCQFNQDDNAASQALAGVKLDCKNLINFLGFSSRFLI
jgi:hypothetical protein